MIKWSAGALMTHYNTLKLPLIPVSYYRLIVESWKKCDAYTQKGHVGLAPPISFCHFAAFGRNPGSRSLLSVSLLLFPPFSACPPLRSGSHLKPHVSVCEQLSLEVGEQETWWQQWDCSTWDGIDMRCSQTVSHALAAEEDWIWARGRLHNVFGGTRPDLPGQVCPIQDGWQHPGVIQTEEAYQRKKHNR